MVRTFTISQSPDALDLYLYPSGNSIVELTPVGDSSNYLCVDETRYAYDEDTTYVYLDSVASGSDLYDMTNHDNELGTINYVTVFSRSKSHQMTQSPTGIFYILCGVNGTISKSSNFAPLTNSYQSLYSIFTVSPDTSSAWTWSEIDNMIAGIECSSPYYTGNIPLILLPNNIGTYTEIAQQEPPTGYHYDKVDDSYGESDENDTRIMEYRSGSYYKDTYSMEDHTSESDTILYVSVFARVSNTSYPVYAKTVMYLNGSISYGSEKTINDIQPNYITISDIFIEKPGGGSWTWSDIDDMECGIALKGTISSAWCTQVYAIVMYQSYFSPQIRTTQCYAVVNYTPSETSLTLNKPHNIDFRHGRKINKIVYNDGKYISDDYGRRNKTLVLNGVQLENADNKLHTLRLMARYGYPITITGLGIHIDGDYNIVNFGVDEDGGCSSRYGYWNLELEKCV